MKQDSKKKETVRLLEIVLLKTLNQNKAEKRELTVVLQAQNETHLISEVSNRSARI